MKYILLLLLFPFITNAQHTVKGTFKSPKQYQTALLYKVEGARQLYKAHSPITSIKNPIIPSNHIGSFTLKVPENLKPGAYRIFYDTQNNGYVDFLYNKEDVVFEFIQKIEGEIKFKESKENLLYTNFLDEITPAQYVTDSLQQVYLKTPKKSIVKQYKKSLKKTKSIQNSYLEKSKETMALDFIKASFNHRSALPLPANELVEYNKKHYFDNIDFTNQNLLNSSFVIERVANYINTYKTEGKSSLPLIKTALDKINDTAFKSGIVMYFISQYAHLKDAEIVNELFENYFDKLPKEHQDASFKEKMKEQIKVAYNVVAPDFSWKDGKKTSKLSELKDGENYILVFYSTGCSHCVREIPQLYTFMKQYNNIKVVAFAMEKDEYDWLNFKADLEDWHHAIGLGKWENKTARTYQVHSTPTYYILDKDKKFIDFPDSLKDLKKGIKALN
ncbi:thioredoxin-like protein [Lutibacter sp. Hel_I_33_5]|uniref:TlpA family protein disulfide reductase n=1 Tax=Lutibacter sp. Hel_I_33_5 TaxID=1566289 RepID=UPI00119E185B|nr:TlpA disulfide reductase family protein [Lutibacter sp. Hel_I_33_5]TVZ56507.1 thioredoxin-like protein [Lutibacter sp. Hel_I_33_5]